MIADNLQHAPDPCLMCGHPFHHATDCGEPSGYDHLNGIHECGCPGGADEVRSALVWLNRVHDADSSQRRLRVVTHFVEHTLAAPGGGDDK